MYYCRKVSKDYKMTKKEVLTDFWIYEMLKEANISLDPQGSSIKELNDALKSASKADTGKVGFQEYCGVIKDFVLIIENKVDVSFHIKRNEKDIICKDIPSVRNYTVNGAMFYRRHLAEKTNYKKILAFGVSGNEKRHRITLIFIDERGGYKELDDVETFTLFSEKKHRGILYKKHPKRRNSGRKNDRRNFKRY